MALILSFISLFASLFVERTDTVMLTGVDIVSSVKMSDDDGALPLSATTVGRVEIEGRHINSVKELSAVVPNFYQPDYGSRLTSSIYVRGFGSRIDQPVVGMSIDQMPVMNKNNYDFELFDIDKVQVIRGAQSTLFGRNTAGGAINITTLSPLNFQGKRLALECGNGNDLRFKAAHYAAPTREFGWSAGFFFNHSDGFFTNSLTGDKCDGGDTGALRLRAQWLPSDGWSIDNTLSAGYGNEGGWGYHSYDAKSATLHPIAYNEECYYRRFNVSDGLVVKRFTDSYTFSSVSGYQYIDDKMHLDNDFLPLDYFTMEQAQREHSFTQEFVVKSRDGSSFRRVAGIFAFYKQMDMSAPVNFREEGIKNLILDKLPADFSIKEERFTIASDFEIPTYGAAAYTQVGFSLGAFDIDAGARIDYEHSSMHYDSRSLVHYTLKDVCEERPLPTRFNGRTSVSALEFLPGISVMYRHRHGNLYASVRRGFKAGGFNTQIFSDILRNMMIYDFLGVSKEVSASATRYKPEVNLNYELGGHFSLLDDNLNLSAALFYISCTDQQVTIMSGAGRMMSNAAESRSWGVELSARYSAGPLTIDASCGYTNAKFERYSDSEGNYSGNYLPYAPQSTYSVNATYNFPVQRSFANRLVLNAGLNGVGRIYWDSANTLSQPHYCTLSASVQWEKGHIGLSLWGKNLLDREYRTFYFESIGNKFFSLGKPLQVGMSLYVNL